MTLPKASQLACSQPGEKVKKSGEKTQEPGGKIQEPGGKIPGAGFSMQEMCESLEKDVKGDGAKKCFLCAEKTESQCDVCGIAACVTDLPLHKSRAGDRPYTAGVQPQKSGKCLPFCVTWREGVGRCVLATRDIQPLELILQDSPVVIGPNYETEAICVECLGRVDGSLLCPACSLAVCCAGCVSGPNHRVECSVFSQLQPKMKIREFGPGTVSYEYGSISVLRLLNLRDSNPEAWHRLSFLMDHDAERREEKQFWKMFQVNVVDFLRERCKLAEVYSEEEIHRAIGIFRTNAFNVERQYMAKQGTSGKAILPTFSFLSHSCMANARYIVLPDDSLELRAQTTIRKGEEITIQYISFLFGNSRRRTDIRDCWFFACGCKRCSDPTELGTNLSALLCECGEAILPQSSVISEKIWKCVGCAKTTSSEEAIKIIRALEVEMMDTFDYELNKYEKIYEKFSPLLHPNNYQILLLKKYMGEAMKGQLTIEQIERKVSLLKQFMDTFKIVDPGFTRWQGRMEYEANKTKLFVADIKFSQKLITKEEFVEILKECIAGLEYVVESLQYEIPGTKDDILCQLAMAGLAQTRDVLHFTSVL